MSEVRELVRRGHEVTVLTRTENDYSEKAHVLNIHVISAEGGFNKEIAKLANFEECLVRAEYEAVKSDEFARKPGAKGRRSRRSARPASPTPSRRSSWGWATRPGRAAR